ncbi:hypothetical protein LOD99_14062 [Oopsacas minuta]|uniref:Uncharacterized protein n=1 Tax=Oopsacas minuta TaxID=111878 RepID=A0AAV7KGR0_9METZ|nr:hypothetical protein LOD99_14062 [Oopsacas minuta]
MAINREIFPPAYDEVIGDVATESTSIALQPISPYVHGAIRFSRLKEDQEPPSAKELEAKGPVKRTGPEYDPGDDIIAPVGVTPRNLEQRGKREFVIRLSCPSCDCSELVPSSGNFTCCTPGLGCLKKLKYLDNAKEVKFFPNYYWSKISDRHFRYFFRKNDNVNENFARYMNLCFFTVFLAITTIMFVITPWIAIIPAILLPCDQNSAIKPLLGTFGAVVLGESFMRSFCYILHKIDRPHRVFKEIESPNIFGLLMIGLFIAITLNTTDLIPCEYSTVILIPPVNYTLSTCCDPTLMSVSYAVPISWVVFHMLVMVLTFFKCVMNF